MSIWAYGKNINICVQGASVFRLKIVYSIDSHVSVNLKIYIVILEQQLKIKHKDV